MEHTVDKTELKIENVIALFHREAPLACRVEEIRQEEKDARYVAYLDFPEGKFVLKLAANGFTTAARVEGWARLIAAYGEMGCYSPAMRKSLQGNYAERIQHAGRTFVAWEEEYAKYPFPAQVEHRPVNGAGSRYVYQDEAIAFYGRVAQARLKGGWGSSGWVRLAPFGADEETDEIMGCVAEFDGLVKALAPQFMGRWEKVLGRFHENRKALGRIYPKLPTSVFQGDWGSQNLLVDESGHFKGMIDYNLAGEDTALNMCISMSLFGFGDPTDMAERMWEGANPPGALPWMNARADGLRTETMLEKIRLFGRHYAFSPLEAEAAPLLYRYIVPIEYTQISALRENSADRGKLSELFDFMEHALTREDIDFKGAMLGC